MENYDLFGDDLGSGMLDSLAELGATDSGFGTQQSNSSQRQGSNADNLMQNFANHPPSYTQIGQQQQQNLNQPNKMNPNQAYPDYSSQYAQYAATGQPGLGAYGVPPSSQTPSRPMTGYSPYHQPGVPSSGMHYPDYSVPNPSMMRPGGGLVPPAQQLAPPPSRMASPGPPHVSQQQQQFGGYRPSSQDLYAQQMRWNEQQGYGSAIPHHYPSTGSSAYRQPQPHAYPSSLPRPPQSQVPPGPQVQQPSQQTQSSGPHSMPYMNRTQGPTNVMSQAQYPQSMYPSSSQQYPDYHHSSGNVSRVGSVPQSTPSYGTPHTPHHAPTNQQQYTGMSAAQHPQYNSQYSQYYQGQTQGSQGISSNLPQTSASNPMAGSPYTPYGNPPGMPPISPALNGNQGYRPPGPGGYVQIPQSSPRPPIASPRPPAPSPRPPAPSTPTIPMSPAQQQGLPPGPPQSMQPQNQGPSSLQQLEQMVMPSLKNSPSPKPHLPSGVMSPLSGPKTPMSPGMVAPKTPLSPNQWQPPPMSRQGPGPGQMGKQGSHPPPQPHYHQQQQQQQLPPMSQASNSPLGMQLPPQHIPQSPLSNHSSLDNSMNNCNSKSNSQDNSEINIDQLTSTLDTSMDGTGTNSNSTTEDLNKSNTPTYQSSPVQPLPRITASATPTPLAELSSINSDNVNNDSLNSLSSQLSNNNSGQPLEDNKFSSPTSNKIGSTPHESPSIESDSNLGLCTDNSVQQSQLHSSSNSSSGDSSTNVTLNTQPLSNSNNPVRESTPTSTTSTPISLPNSFQQQPIPITSSHSALSSLTNSGSSSPVQPLGPPSQGNQVSHQPHTSMMNPYQGPQSNQNSYGSNGPMSSQGMASPLLSSQSNPPHQYPSVYSQASNEIQSQQAPSIQPGYYNTTGGNNYPPSQYPHHGSLGMVPPTGPPSSQPHPIVPHPGGMPHGPTMQIQYEIHQIQSQLQILYNAPPNPQSQMQISELQDRLRVLQQQQAAQGPFPPIHGIAVPPPPHGGPPMMYSQQMPIPDMSMDQFPSDGMDEFKGKGKGKKKERKPREPKGPGKGKGKGKKQQLDFDPMVMNQQTPPPYGIPQGPGPMSSEVYEFQDVPPEIPEKKLKKPRKPREHKSPKEKKTKEPKTVKEKSPKKSRKKKSTEDASNLLNSSMGDDSFGLDSSLVKTEENFESDPKNGIGAAGIIAAEGGSAGLSSSGEGDTSTQDGTIPTTIEENTESFVDAVSTEPLNPEQITPKPSPKKKSKPKMKSSGSSKKRPTRTTLIASLAAKKKKKRNRSDSEGCSDLDATPPPSPPPEEDNSNKRRSGRNNTRKKYIDDIVLALSDDELIVPSNKSPAKNLEIPPTTTASENLGGEETPLVQSEAPTPGIATPLSAPTPTLTADDSSQNTTTKPNFVYVNPAEEDTMIIQHILCIRMGKRDIIASDSSDDEEEEKKPEKEIEKEVTDTHQTQTKADALLGSELDKETEIKIKAEKPEELKEEKTEEKVDEPKEEMPDEIAEEATEEVKEEITKEKEEKMDCEPSDSSPKANCEDGDATDVAKESNIIIKEEETDQKSEEGESEDKLDENTKKLEPVSSENKPVKPKKEPRVLETVEVEEFYVKYKNFSYLHCEWKTEDELQKGDKRAIAKIKRFKQKQNNRDLFEFLEEDPFNPEYIEVDRILDMSEVKDPATGKITKNYLVKWRALAYDECTWELEDDIDPEKLKQYYAFCNPPTRDQWKVKKRPKGVEWIKLDESPVYKNGNTLRPYQLEGLNWLSFSWFNGRNCILADEMGLGKTIQSLTFVDSVHRYGIRGPFLVIAPLSTVPNWQREFETWTDLNVVVYHGSVASRNMIQEYELFYRHPDNPQMNIKDVFKFNVLITTFEIVLTDVLDLKDFPWRVCIIDEAHRLKNKNCKLLEGLRLLNLEHRVLLSGTPLQNNINELFSLLNFLEPAQFSSDENFKKEFGELTTDTQVQKLQALLKPMMLRRLKEDVEKSIAPKEETIVEVELTNMQKKYYRGILEKNFSFLSKGTSSANIPNLMNTMMELRKCCIHPYLLNGAEDEIQRDYRIVHGGPDDGDLYYKALVASSGKMVLVDKLLPKLRANGHRVLIFSQMVRCLDILEDYLIYMKYPFERIDGRIRGPLRQAAIDRYSKPDSDRFVFLLCTKAGGLGINLTAADTVIIYDSDWNPQNDLQAQARCHRIGQAKMVKVYRLICRNTYEREMFDRASLKLGLDKAVLQSMNTSQSQGKGIDTNPNKQLSKKEVEDLLKKGAYGALMDEDNAGDKFCEEDIDCILQRRTQIITLETGEKGSTFSKASFASTGIREDINVDDPDFWNKWAKKAEIDMDDMNQRNDLVIHEPRRRTQIKRYGHDEQIMEINSDIESTSDSDEEGGGGGIGDRTRGRGKQKKSKSRRSRRGLDEDYHCDDGVVEYGRWSKSECYKIEKGLLTFGWARWTELLEAGQFRAGWTEKEIEDCARMILVHCVNNFRGDEKVRSFVQDLIHPSDDGSKVTRNHLGLANPVSRGGRKSKKKRGDKTSTPSPEPPIEWIKDEKYDPDVHLDGNYKKHVGKHANKVLLRIRMLYYIKQEIIGEYAAKIRAGAPCSEIPICPTSLTTDNGPVSWWDREADTSLLIGTFKHGYEKYNLMRMDPDLCFLPRCGPPDGSAVLAEISADVNEEELDKAVGGDVDEDDESNIDPAVVEKQSGKQEEESVKDSEAEPKLEKETEDDEPVKIKTEAEDEPSSTDPEKLPFPIATDLNTRIRKLITSFQRYFKKEEVRNAQKVKRQERKEKIDQIVREREKQKLEVYQKRWSKKEESDFYRTISSYGILYNRKDKSYDWSKFRAISRLDKKFDETLTEYYRAFYAMCKRICGKKLSEEEEFDLIQVPVEPVAEDRARKTLERIDLLSKIREEIIYNPQLEERLKLCQPSLDLPEWWVPGKHDKDLLLGAARHGLGRTDIFYLNDSDLSFREILRRHIAGESLMDQPDKSRVKSEKKSKNNEEKKSKRDMVDIEIKDIKQEREDARKAKAVEAATAALAEKEKELETERNKESTPDRSLDEQNISTSNTRVKEETKDQEESMDLSNNKKDALDFANKSSPKEVVIKKETEEVNDEAIKGTVPETEKKYEEQMETEQAEDDNSKELNLSTKTRENEPKEESEPSNGKVDAENEQPDDEPPSKRRKMEEASSVKSPADYSNKGHKKDDEESTKSSSSDMNEVQVEIKDEFKITIKLPAEKMKKVEVQVKGSPKFSVPEPPAPASSQQSFPTLMTTEELLSAHSKSILNPENLSTENLDALGSLMNQMNPIRWPRDRAIQIRLEHIVFAVEKGEWPVSKFFSSAALPDIFEYTTPQGTPDTSTPIRDTPTPISECSDLAPTEELIMTLPSAQTTTTTASGGARRGRRRRIAIDVETERAKLQALLNQGLHNSIPQLPRLSSLRGNNHHPNHDKDDSEGESQINRNKFQPPPAHSNVSSLTASLLRSSHQKQQLQSSTQRSSPTPRFAHSQGSTLDLSLKSSDRNIAAAAMSALSSLSSVTVTPVTLQSPRASNNNSGNASNSAPMDLSSTRTPPSRRERERERREQLQMEQNLLAERITRSLRNLEKPPSPEPESERPKVSKLENMLDKLRKRKLGDSEGETQTPLPVEKEKRKKKLDEIVFGLSASKGQGQGNNLSSLFSPPVRGNSRGTSPASSRLQSPPTSAAFSQFASQQNLKDIATSQANLLNNSLLSATLSLFNSAAGKELSRQLAGQASAATKGKESTSRTAPGTSQMSEIPKCDLSRLAELAVPKFDLFSQDAKVNKWLAEHANLTPDRPVSPDLLDGRRRRRPRVDPMLLDWSKLSGEENVTVVHRMTGKKITGTKAPQLKHVAQWLLDNPMYDVDPRWSDIVKEKGNLSKGNGDKKKGPGRPQMMSSPSTSMPTSTSTTTVPTSSSSNLYSSLQGFPSIPGLNPNLLAGLPFGSLDPKNPLFMPFGGLGSLGGLGNLSSLGNLGSLGSLSSLGLTNSLFGFGLPGMDLGTDKNKETPTSGTSAQTTTVSSSSSKKDDKSKKSSMSSQNMLSSALPFLFPNPGLMYNPLGLGSFPLGGGMNPPYGNLSQSSLLNGMGGSMNTGSGGKKSSSSASKSNNSANAAAALGLAGLAGLNIPSFNKKDLPQNLTGSSSQRSKSPAAKSTTSQPSSCATPGIPSSMNPEDSDDESMKSLMGNHADDLPEDDTPGENAERIVLRESKELEKEMAQQKMETRRERRVRDRSSLGPSSESHRGGLTAAERQLLMVKKKERLAKEDQSPSYKSGSGRTTRRSAAAASRLEDTLNKIRPSEGPNSEDGSEDQ